MGKIKTIIIFILIITAVGIGVYFSAQGGPASGWKDDAVRLYTDFSNGIKKFQKTDIGNLITKAGQEIFLPPPLNIGGSEKQVVLLKSKIIEETNLQRRENGNLPALIENLTLDKIALAKVEDMFKNQYFEHVSPAGVGPGELAKSFGYEYILEGENLILGNFSSEKEAVQYWMDSPGHRANILNNRYTEIGVAIIKETYNGKAVWIGAQEFGFPLSNCRQPDSFLKNNIDLSKQQLDLISQQIEELRNQIDNTNRRSAGYKQLIDNYNQLVQTYNSLADQVKAMIDTYNQQANIFNACVNGK